MRAGAVLCALASVISADGSVANGETARAVIASMGGRDGNVSIKVRLLAGHKLRSIQLEGYAGLRLSGQRAQGRVTLAADGNSIIWHDEGKLKSTDRLVTAASRGSRWIDIHSPHVEARRTVGWLQITARDGYLCVVDVLPLETYVLGVVDPELGSIHFSPESLKAQIVASRSYVLALRGRHAREGYDFCDTPHCQVFTGTAMIRPEFKMAMEESRGLYLSYNGRAIPGFFHDNCGGRTASAEDVWGMRGTPYLRGVDDGGDNAYCRHAPRAHWEFFASRSKLASCFRKEGWLDEHAALDDLRVMTQDSSGRADQVMVQSGKPLWVAAADLRQALIRHFGKEVLPSTVFTIARETGGFRFVGRGWGHGVGLCQWGAIQMAREGKNFKEILVHYYPGTSLDRLPEPAWASAPHEPAVN